MFNAFVSLPMKINMPRCSMNCAHIIVHWARFSKRGCSIRLVQICSQLYSYVLYVRANAILIFFESHIRLFIYYCIFVCHSQREKHNCTINQWPRLSGWFVLNRKKNLIFKQILPCDCHQGMKYRRGRNCDGQGHARGRDCSEIG
jgi:hypothetical protein